MEEKKQPTLEQVITWAKEAGRIAREGFLMAHEIGYKSATDVVTEIDHQCEKYILDAIRADFPDHAILAEESGAVNSGGTSTDCWYVDPLDGTINYSHQLPIYVISIGYQHDGDLKLGVVYDPARDECFTAERGKGAHLNGKPIHASEVDELEKSLLSTSFSQHNPEHFARNMRNFEYLARSTQGVRRLGCAAVEMCYVACGRTDAYWELKINAWDIAAGGLICEEAGASVTDIEGKPDYFKPPYPVLSCAPGIRNQLVDLFEKLK